MPSEDYLKRVCESTFGTPAEQSSGVDWQKFMNRFDEFRNMLSGRTLTSNPKIAIMNEMVSAINDKTWRLCKEKGIPWIQKWYYPGDNEFAVFLSHDVDEIDWSWRRKLLMSVRHPSSLAGKKRHYYRFEEVMELERKRGLRSTFFFVPKSRDKRDPPYSISDVAGICQELRKGGWEVGVHGSYHSYKNKEFMEEEKRMLEEVLGEEIPGIRQHFVNFDPDMTFTLQNASGYKYDSSIGFNNVSGFPTGFCHPYRFEDVKLIEIPLMVMDGQLFWHEKKDAQGAVEEVKRLLAVVRQYHGVLTLDWHQRTFDRYSFPGWADAYIRVLDHLSSMNVFATTGQEIANWWKRRDDARFVERKVGKDSVEWQILCGRKIEGLSFRIRVPRGSGYKDVEVDSKAGFSEEEKNNEIWIKFGAIPQGERLHIRMSK